MQLTPRRGSHVEQLVEVARRVHLSDGYPVHLPGGDYAHFLANPDPLAAWVAVDDSGTVVGHVALNAESSSAVMEFCDAAVGGDSVAFVARLLVDPRSRRSGVGQQLLDQARRQAVALGHVPMLDVVDVPSSPAVALYRRTGWQQLGSVKVRFGGREITELIFRGSSE